MLDIAGFAQYAVIEFLAARRRPLQKLHRAVNSNIFLVPGDEKRDGPCEVAAVCSEIVQHRRDAAGDAAFHVDGPAAIEKTVLDVARERTVGPRTLVARRHHIGMSGKSDMWRAPADAGIEIF